jgi:hypothetical protein
MGLGILFGLIVCYNYLFGDTPSRDPDRSIFSKLCFIAFMEWPLLFSYWAYTDGSIIIPMCILGIGGWAMGIYGFFFDEDELMEFDELSGNKFWGWTLIIGTNLFLLGAFLG